MSTLTGRVPKYEVHKAEGTFKKVVYSYEGEEGSKLRTLTPREVERPMGFMVYFPRGHSFHVETEAELKRLGLHYRPPVHDTSLNEDVPGQYADGDEDTLARHASRVNKPRMKKLRDDVLAAQ